MQRRLYLGASAQWHLDFYAYVLRVFSRPSRAHTATEVSELPAKSAKSANDRMPATFCGAVDAAIA